MYRIFTSSVRTSLATALLLCVVSGVLSMCIPTTSYAADAPPAPQGGASANGPGAPGSLVEAAQMAEVPAGDFGCFGGNNSADIGVIDGCINLLAYYFMQAAMMSAVWVGVALNWVVMELVVNMGTFVGNIIGITIAWEVLRDVANVFLVFLTIFVGISIIIGSSGFGSKQLLWKIIIAALFVNFSITLTKLVIDVSNLVATATFDTILKEHAVKSGAKTQVTSACLKALPNDETAQKSGCITVGIAGVFWSKMEVTKVFNIKELQSQGAPKDMKDPKISQLRWVGLMGGLMFFTMAFVFGAAAILLIIRFTILCFLIVVSPLAFVMLVTGVGGEGRKWWDALLQQSFFAPAIFLMWWIAYMMFTTLMSRINLSGKSIAASGGGDMGALGIFTYFFIMISILVASLVIAKKMGGSAAAAGMGMYNRAVRGAPGMMWGGTKAIGRGSKSVYEGSKILGGTAKTRADRRERKMAESLAKDPTSKLTAGDRYRRAIAGTKYDQARKAKVDAAAAPARERDKAKTARLNEIKETGKALENKKAIKTAVEHAGKDVAQMQAEGVDAVKIREIEDARRAIAAMSPKEVEGIHDALVKNVESAIYLSANQMEAVMKSDKFTESERESVRTNKYSKEIAVINGRSTLSTAEQGAVMSNMKDADLDLLHNELVANPDKAEHLSADQLKHVFKSTKFGESERARIHGGKFKKILDAAAAGDAGAITDALEQISEAEAEMLGDELLANQKVIENMPQRHIEKVMASTQVSGTRKATINTTRTNHLNALIAGPVDGKSIDDVLRKAKRSEIPKMGAPVRNHITTQAQHIRSGAGKGIDNQISIDLTSHFNTHGRNASASEEQTIRRNVIARSGLSNEEKKILEIDDYLNNPTVSATF
ncbi:MAG: hypothetical protein KBD24_01720 [Candidatus Pacebacteria bacterium]|nr:hypothetical protein [Candidatus Paceibacterota bacterium]